VADPALPPNMAAEEEEWHEEETDEMRFLRKVAD
jgi:hypothetical protein